MSCYVNVSQRVLSIKRKVVKSLNHTDFYEEMVAFGKEVYGIDLKKAGTK